jgi:RNA-directed DNA polymerase
VTLNTDKTRTVNLTAPGATFAFLGFDFRWTRSPRTGRFFPYTSPRKKKVIEVLRSVSEVLRRRRHRPVQAVVAEINPRVRGWVNYFRTGNSVKELAKVKWEVQQKVR